MKKLLLLLLFIPLVSFGQYSTYYGAYDINANVSVNANINKNVNVTGNVNKTITTIDYGALANANAIREQNRINREIHQYNLNRDAALAIAKDPILAYDYGKDFQFWWDTSSRKLYETKKRWRIEYRAPHSFLFTNNSEDCTYYGPCDRPISLLNISPQGVATNITIYGSIVRKEGVFLSKNQLNYDVERLLEFENQKVGELSHWKGDETRPPSEFIHYKEIKRAQVYGSRGFVGTIVVEDKYDKIINDIYLVDDTISKGKKRILLAIVTYTAEKDVSFEIIEGRRNYLKPLVNKVIANAKQDYTTLF